MTCWNYYKMTEDRRKLNSKNMGVADLWYESLKMQFLKH